MLAPVRVVRQRAPDKNMGLAEPGAAADGGGGTGFSGFNVAMPPPPLSLVVRRGRRRGMGRITVLRNRLSFGGGDGGVYGSFHCRALCDL
jgi:hypothetical protein